MMQIHELDTYTGTPSDSDFLAVDDGTETFKVPMTSVGVSQKMVDVLPTLVVEVSSFSSLPQTVTNANITSDMVVVNSVLGTPSAQTGDWTVTTANGSLTIAGNISGSTTLTLYLMKSR